MTGECAHERDMLDAVASGDWPTAVEPALRAHVSACDSCSAVADLATMLRDDHDALCREAQIPSAAHVWRRAAIRTRVEAQHTAAQPIIVTERLAAACATGVVFAAFSWVAPARAWAAVATHAATRLAESCSDLTIASSAALKPALPLVMGLTACAIMVPVALHFLLLDD
jgi:hypothetical protein